MVLDHWKEPNSTAHKQTIVSREFVGYCSSTKPISSSIESIGSSKIFVFTNICYLDSLHSRSSRLEFMNTPQAATANRSDQTSRRQPQPGFLATLWRNAPLIILAYFASSWVSSYFKPSSNLKPVTPSNQANVEADHLTVPIWPVGTPLDIHVRLSTSSDMHFDDEYSNLPQHKFTGIKFGDWTWEKLWEIDFEVPKSVKNNGTLWAVIIVSKAGAEIDHRKPNYSSLNVLRKQKLLTRYLPKRNVRKTKSLLGATSGNMTSETKQSGDEHLDKNTIAPSILSYYHPNLTIGLVSDYNVLPLKKLPPVVQSHFSIPSTKERDPVTHNFFRYPAVFPNDFWLLKEHFIPINETTTSLHLRLMVHPMSHWKFQLFATMTVAFEQQANKAGGAAELDEIKRMFTETAPWLLITTFVVSALHALFEFLAFSSDVTHWRNKKELVGVSIRTILSNIFVQIVVLLYLLDNSEGTSWIVLIGQGTGVVIEAWKITKAVDIKFVSSDQGNVRYVPWLQVTDKHVLTEDEKKTQEYDALAFRWVSYVAVPSLAGYTIYSLIYHEHRGWYSFVIGTLSSFVYAFGFIELVPQLVINYKLKSVAHMPMKAMMYKTLNTVVDDLFAFCIKMPILHRLACFRDDVVFVILLYQYWIYKIDYSRVNEFGQPGAQHSIGQTSTDSPSKEPGPSIESKKNR
ncbi:hypothetical protein O181_033066 [Austropuccinia psidii MF-1]|uniref:Cleft lip and palate transmembrane protein 1 n=1 Tax=Austropuccinia psidii MF-1 TaxID=1389203 RepID=A0A9Q3CY10_9BASI|nr:hypothetical protein [Austropuccinia psidii MF-1]